MKKVSVIISAYNVGNYLDNCLQSVIKQSYQNLEIIVVDDGSTDATLSICQKYASNDQRIKLVYQNHQGASIAKNNGLTHANGELITFINATDSVEEDYVTDLVNQMGQAGSDIAVTFYKVLNDRTGQFLVLLNPNPGDNKYDGTCSAVEWMKQIGPQLKELNTSVWGKLYKRKLFNNFLFPQDFQYYEDAVANWQLNLTASRISFQNKINYTLRINRGKSQNISPQEQEKRSIEHVQYLEEQITMMDVLKLDPTYLLDEFKTALEELQSRAGTVSDYDQYYQAAGNLQIINKYQGQQEH